MSMQELTGRATPKLPTEQARQEAQLRDFYNTVRSLYRAGVARWHAEQVFDRAWSFAEKHDEVDEEIKTAHRRREAGHTIHATGGRHFRSAGAHGPSAAQIAADAAVARQRAYTVLDTFVMRDGRPIGDVRYGELERIATADLVEASVIRQILDHAKAPHDAKVRDVVKPTVLKRMIAKARGGRRAN